LPTRSTIRMAEVRIGKFHYLKISPDSSGSSPQ